MSRKYRCTDRMCGCPDCSTCHPENFRNGVYIDEERQAEEKDARDMERDRIAYAKWVADLLKADGVPPEQVTPELALAYFDEVGRRIEKLQTAYLTRTGARSAMQLFIAKLLTE